jgi:hypothetical protein
MRSLIASRRALIPLGGLILAVNAACGSDFTPFNEIDRLRILSISSDPPWITRTSTTGPIPAAALSALVVNGPEVPLEGVTYEWSWCPLRAAGTSDGGYECAFSEVASSMGMEEIPPEVFDLGTGSTAELPYIVPPDTVRQICEELSMAELPAFVTIPSCDNGFPVSVQLIVRQGAEQSVALKDVVLAYEADKVNRNPRITDLAFLAGTSTTPVAPNAEGKIKLKRGQTYRLVAAVDQADSEPYTFVPADTKVPETRRENLVITWFIEGGDADRTRTSWLPQVDDSDAAWLRARTLEFTPPKTVDFTQTSARLYLVIRDGRQGQTYYTRTVELEE